jgi:wyosine [tRNA(Phe)-imidazoG37] synthetase (radical SAM superfamily)
VPAPIPLQPDLAYGPVASRRLGRSLGVNLLPTDRKVCSFSCVYCQYADTPGEAGELPAPAAILAAVERALGHDPACDAITLAGNGEPTLHPAFAEVVAGLAALRDRLAPRAALVLLTNGTHLADPAVRAALPALGRVFVKLDAGDEATRRAIDRPRAGSLAALERALADLPCEWWAQALLVAAPLDTAEGPPLEAWLELLARLRPAGVHVTTVDRGTAVPGVLPVPAARLEAVAARVRGLGIPAQAFPCGDEGRFADS